MALKAKTYEELSQTIYISPHDVSPGEYVAPEQTYQATLHVTDDQMKLLTGLVEKELKRVNNDLQKPQTGKKLKALDDQLSDLQAIQATMAENVW